MKKLFTLLLFLSICIHTLLGGNSKKEKFGKIPLELLTMTVYEKDSNAHAVVIFEIAEYKVKYTENKGLICHIQQHLRIKILDKEGLGYGSFEIPAGKKDKLFGIKGITANYNPITKSVQNIPYDTKTLIIDHVNDYFDVYKIAFPQVKSESVLDLLFEQEIDNINYLPTWHFQHKIPAIISEITLKKPENIKYTLHVGGLLTILEEQGPSTYERVWMGNGNNATYKQDEYKYLIKDIRAFKTEPFIGCETDNMSLLDFERVNVHLPSTGEQFKELTWPLVSKLLMESEHFGDQMKFFRFVKSELELLKPKFKDSIQFANLILAHVKDKVKWNEKFRMLTTKDLDEVYEEGIGNSAEMNLLLYSFLKTADYPVYPFLLSTSDHGRIKSFSPTLDKFNHVIVLWMNKDGMKMMDATSKNAPVGILPRYDRNYLGLVVGDNMGMLLEPAQLNNRKTTVYNFTLTPEGKMTGTITHLYDEERALYKRDELSDSMELEMKRKIRNRFEEAEIKNYTVSNLKEINEKLIEKIEISIPDVMEKSGSGYLFQPVLFNPLKENPLEENTRNYPIQFPIIHHDQMIITITLPINIVLLKAPENKYFYTEDKGMEYKYLFSESENILQFQIDQKFNKTFFDPSEYKALQLMFDKIVEMDNQYLIFSFKK